jgi:purine-binding chemotaxis protein CheW
MISSTKQAEKTGVGQVLTFRLGDEGYGVDILRVKEIRGWTPVTRIPQSRPHVLGVLNLRGSIVPIIDLRVRFCLEKADFTPLTVVIVLSIATATGSRECGLVVDSVSEVLDISADALRPAPGIGGLEAECIRGLASINDQMTILLDVDELVGRELSAAVPQGENESGDVRACAQIAVQ